MVEQAMAMRKREDEVVFPNAAGIDVGASSHWAAVPWQLAEQAGCEPVREFGAMTDDLHALADWLLACGVDTVALESTGVYWIPVYEVLEQRGLTVWLVDARQLKYVPGRKSDVLDCQWLQKLMSLGLLRAAFRPDDEVCVVRAVVRQREVLLEEQACWVQRMQKALVQMNLQLTEVLTDVMGMTGQAIIRAIVAGERDPAVLARHRHGRVKASVADIQRALTGNWREEHLFVLSQALAMYDSLAQRMAECDAKLQALLAPLGCHEANLSGPGKRAGKNTPAFDLRTALARWAGVDLTRINGLAVTSVLTVLSEIGPDLRRFANVKHFCSWLGLCPGTKISGGKVLSARTRRSTNRVRQALKLAAMSLSRNHSALGAFYRRLCARMDKPRANTAVAHKLARMVYFMLTRGEAFVDQGQQKYEDQQRQRSIAALRRRAADLGFAITPATAATP
jgi:transposase